MKRNMKIGIVGFGIVGSATQRIFSDLEPIVYDKFKEGFSPLEEVVEKSDEIFFCLPTPVNFEKMKGKLQDFLDTLYRLCSLVEKSDRDAEIVIRSTVPIGFAASFRRVNKHLYPKVKIISNPEFLRANSWEYDALNPNRIVIGRSDPDSKTPTRLERLYKERFPEVPMFMLSTTGAEMVKLFSNAFLSTKVTFANAIFDICKEHGVDYDIIKEAVGADPRIGIGHLSVTKERGFGGACLPKDLVLLIDVASHFNSLNHVEHLLNEIWNFNLKVRTVRDWEG